MIGMFSLHTFCAHIFPFQKIAAILTYLFFCVACARYECILECIWLKNKKVISENKKWTFLNRPWFLIRYLWSRNNCFCSEIYVKMSHFTGETSPFESHQQGAISNKFQPKQHGCFKKCPIRWWCTLVHCICVFIYAIQYTFPLSFKIISTKQQLKIK